MESEPRQYALGAAPWWSMSPALIARTLTSQIESFNSNQRCAEQARELRDAEARETEGPQSTWADSWAQKADTREWQQTTRDHAMQAVDCAQALEQLSQKLPANFPTVHFEDLSPHQLEVEKEIIVAQNKAKVLILDIRDRIASASLDVTTWGRILKSIDQRDLYLLKEQMRAAASPRFPPGVSMYGPEMSDWNGHEDWTLWNGHEDWSHAHAHFAIARKLRKQDRERHWPLQKEYRTNDAISLCQGWSHTTTTNRQRTEFVTNGWQGDLRQTAQAASIQEQF